MGSQDGEPIGTLTSFSVGGDGTIIGQFTNGLTKALGQVALANFNNPEGLIAQGNNLYDQGPNSGSALIGGATANGTGTVESGALEQSNVDLSREFINLIIASTGFSASSKVISTSDQLLTNLLNSQI
jgi:flagellar hook protein FlgE